MSKLDIVGILGYTLTGNENHSQLGGKMPRGFGNGRGWWCNRFAGRGYKLTMSRQAILEVLNSTSRHLSAEEIFLLVHKSYPGTGLATVYRTLDLLTQMGLTCKFDFGDGKSHYELVDGAIKSHHHHLI